MNRKLKMIGKILLSVGLMQLSNVTIAQQRAFPTAEGAGAFVTGGRGTPSIASTVYEVTSLNDTNTPGTLRYAVNATTSYRTIVFRVSGTIHLTSALRIKANTTIAGQTAPGDGICLADYPVQVNGNNVIIRYIRCRLGDKNQNKGMVNGSGDDDALDDASNSHKNIIIDHCTASWSTDEAMTFYNGDSLTLQWNIISEPLNYSYHFETGDTDWERHGYGGIWGGQHASFHHNLFAHCISRTPRFNGSRYFYPLIENAELVNNVIYNWQSNNVYGGEGGNYNIIGNYYKYGPSTTSKNRIVNPNKQTTSPVLPFGKYYITGNYMDGSSTVTNNNWRGVIMGNGAPTSDTALIKVLTPFVISGAPISIQTAEEAYTAVLAGAGCSLPNRDTLDARIRQNVVDRTGAIIDVQGGFPHGTAYNLTVNAWPALLSKPAPADSDHDGMPDEWETERGLNPANAADRNGYHANGYTHLENYLNGDSIVATGVKENCIQTSAIQATGSGKWLFAKDSAYARLVSTDTVNVVAALKDDENYGGFSVSYFTTAQARTYNGKAYLSRNISINPANPGSINTPVTVRFYLLQSELAALMSQDPAIQGIQDVRILRQAGNSCPDQVTAATETIVPLASGVYGTYGTGYFLEAQVNAFGNFFFGASQENLPLKLVSFTGKLDKNIAQLQWVSDNETAVKKFEIERSTDGQLFHTTGAVNAYNNNSRNSYSFNDASLPANNLVIYYRLKMINTDGSFIYSPVIKLDIQKGVWHISPNPAKNIVTVYHSVSASEGSIRIYTADGKLVYREKVAANSSHTLLQLPAFKSGTYFVSGMVGTDKKNLRLLIE